MIRSHLASATTRMAKAQANRVVGLNCTSSCALMNHSKNGAIRAPHLYNSGRNVSSTLRSVQPINKASPNRSLLTEMNQQMNNKKRYMSTVETNSGYKIFDLSAMSNLKLAFGAMLMLQATMGSTAEGKPMYDYRFIAKKDPDDIASFYGGEELMELFCVFPLMTSLMLRGAEFDDEGNVTAVGMPGTMHIQMVFSDEYDEDMEATSWFNKRERFKDTLFGITMWDMVINYGFTRLPDGRVEVYHQAEYFKGYAPPISLIMRLVFRVHARYMVWAAEHHINHYAFTAETEEQEHLEEESRKFALLRLLKEYFVDDVKAMAIGSNKETDSFLTKDEDEDEEEEEEEFDSVEVVKEENVMNIGKPNTEINISKRRTAILNRRTTVSSVVDFKKKIEDDIAFDKTVSLNQLEIPKAALESANGDAYQMATLSAMQKRQTRIVRRRTSNIMILPTGAVAEGAKKEA